MSNDPPNPTKQGNNPKPQSTPSGSSNSSDSSSSRPASPPTRSERQGSRAPMFRHTRRDLDTSGLDADEAAFLAGFVPALQARMADLLRAMKDGEHWLLPPSQSCEACRANNWPCVVRIRRRSDHFTCILCSKGKCTHKELRAVNLESAVMEVDARRKLIYKTLGDGEVIPTPPVQLSVLALWAPNPYGWSGHNAGLAREQASASPPRAGPRSAVANRAANPRPRAPRDPHEASPRRGQRHYPDDNLELRRAQLEAEYDDLERRGRLEDFGRDGSEGHRRSERAHDGFGGRGASVNESDRRAAAPSSSIHRRDLGHGHPGVPSEYWHAAGDHRYGLNANAAPSNHPGRAWPPRQPPADRGHGFQHDPRRNAEAGPSNYRRPRDVLDPRGSDRRPPGQQVRHASDPRAPAPARRHLMNQPLPYAAAGAGPDSPATYPVQHAGPSLLPPLHVGPGAAALPSLVELGVSHLGPVAPIRTSEQRDEVARMIGRFPPTPTDPRLFAGPGAAADARPAPWRGSDFTHAENQYPVTRDPRVGEHARFAPARPTPRTLLGPSEPAAARFRREPRAGEQLAPFPAPGYVVSPGVNMPRGDEQREAR
ncbi:hypothetical protein Q8F55_001673 [Vanrija albida]|uniref:Uncharacterized protein n=1 Tax=Vanrija albida TaxID=181172 RepID=A0ABR3Q8H6_9TREE